MPGHPLLPVIAFVGFSPCRLKEGSSTLRSSSKLSSLQIRKKPSRLMVTKTLFRVIC
jgi:hypothetical protein